MYLLFAKQGYNSDIGTELETFFIQLPGIQMLSTLRDDLFSLLSNLLMTN